MISATIKETVGRLALYLLLAYSIILSSKNKRALCNVMFFELYSNVTCEKQINFFKLFRAFVLRFHSTLRVTEWDRRPKLVVAG